MFKKRTYVIEVKTTDVNAFAKGEICGVLGSFTDMFMVSEDRVFGKTRFTVKCTAWRLANIVTKIEGILPELYFRVV